MPSVPARSADLPRSGIRAIMDRAWASRQPVLRLEVGQPDSQPPDHVLDAIAAAEARGQTGYTPNAGIPELRTACSAKLARVNGIRRPPEEVLVSAGSTQGLAVAVLGLGEPGDEMLVPDPGWPNHGMIARLASLAAVPYPLRPGNGYRPDFAEIDALVTGRTRLVLVNSPSNPLGVVWEREVMAGWLELAERHDLWLLSDECYDEIRFDAEVVSPAALPGGDERVVTAHSLSKTYAMTGLRVGYVSGPAAVIDTLAKMQEALIACVNGPAQHGAVAALEGPQDFVRSRRDTYRRRRDRSAAVSRSLGLPHLLPEGAFYVWLPLGEAIGEATSFCERLLDERGVAVAPGDTFGALGAGAVRVSLAAPDDDIAEGLQRIAGVLA